MQLVGNDFGRGWRTLWMTFISKGDLNVFSLCRFYYLNSVTEPRLSTSWRSNLTSMFIRMTFHFLEPLSLRHLRWSNLYCGSYTWPYSSFAPGDSWVYNLAKDLFPSQRWLQQSLAVGNHPGTYPSLCFLACLSERILFSTASVRSEPVVWVIDNNDHEPFLIWKSKLFPPVTLDYHWYKPHM